MKKLRQNIRLAGNPTDESHALVLFAAARLRIGARRLRALANGDAAAVREFVQNDSALRLAEARRDAREDLAALNGADARAVSLADEEYPGALLDLPNAPAFLCVRGRIPAGGIAIVGSREASDAACAFAFALAHRLDRPLVSGLATGVDAAAHRGALAGGRDQVAYVGSGIAHMYPPEHADLADSIVRAGGAIVSERLPDEVATRWSLMQRDRLQAAHADAVVLVESPLDGGAMHTMRFARELGRRRFVLDGLSEGNRFESTNGATVLSRDIDDACATLFRALTSP